LQNLNKTQKIVLYLIGGIAIVLIIVYFFTKDKVVYNDYSNLDVQESEIVEENFEEETKNIISVYVVGEVNNPSVVELEEGARIIDAIEKAGGLTDSGEVKNLNLAYKLKDGEKLYIPSLDDVIKSEEENTKILYIFSGIDSSNMVEVIAIGNSETIESNITNDNGLININTCTQVELETLDGIGPSTAKKIIDYREENGRFKKIEDIQNVSGIGEATFNNIKNDICV